MSKQICESSQFHSKIKDWPRDERPREKLLHRGAHALSDAELLAILIRSGTGNVTAVDLAKRILTDFSSLSDLSSRTVEELTQYRGLGKAKGIAVIAAFELGRRTAACQRGKRSPISSPQDIVNRYQPMMRDLKQEKFQIILLNSANHILRDVEISTGILDSSLVHPREVFRHAILEPAASVILLHNHPSGNPEPSGEDIQITQQLVEAGKIMGIPVHDHIIIAGDAYTSFAERGIL